MANSLTCMDQVAGIAVRCMCAMNAYANAVLSAHAETSPTCVYIRPSSVLPRSCVSIYQALNVNYQYLFCSYTISSSRLHLILSQSLDKCIPLPATAN